MTVVEAPPLTQAAWLRKVLLRCRVALLDVTRLPGSEANDAAAL
jgi:hypothetical protein